MVAFRLIVVKFDVFKNGLLELADAGERAGVNASGSDLETGARPSSARNCWSSEVHVKPWVTSQPPPYLGMLVGRIVICHQVQFSLRIGRGVDVLQKLDPLLVSMPRHTRINHNAFRHVERCEQRGGAVAVVIVGPGAQTAGINGQALLHAIEGLNLRLLVDAQHNGMRWWVQIQAEDVTSFSAKSGSLLNLNVSRDALEIRILPHPMHHRRRRAQVLGQRPRAPMRGGAGVSVVVVFTIRAANFSLAVEGRPPRAASFSIPASRCWAKGCAHATVLRNVPSSSAISCSVVLWRRPAQ